MEDQRANVAIPLAGKGKCKSMAFVTQSPFFGSVDPTNVFVSPFFAIGCLVCLLTFPGQVCIAGKGACG